MPPTRNVPVLVNSRREEELELQAAADLLGLSLSGFIRTTSPQAARGVKATHNPRKEGR